MVARIRVIYSHRTNIALFVGKYEENVEQKLLIIGLVHGKIDQVYLKLIPDWVGLSNRQEVVLRVKISVFEENIFENFSYACAGSRILN